MVHPLQVLLDNPLAFGALGQSRFIYKKKNGLVIGYIVGVCGRFVMLMISGLIFYTEYVGDAHGNLVAIWGSTVYNMSYIVPEMVLTLILLAIPAVRKAMERIKQMATE